MVKTGEIVTLQVTTEAENGVVILDGVIKFRYHWNLPRDSDDAAYALRLWIEFPYNEQGNQPEFKAHGPGPRPSEAGVGRVRAVMQAMRWYFYYGLRDVPRQEVTFAQVLTGRPLPPPPQAPSSIPRQAASLL